MIEELIDKVNNAFKVDLKHKKMTRLSTYLKIIIVSKTDLNDVELANLLNRDRVTIVYYRKRYSELKKYSDFKELIEKVEEL